MKQSINLIGGGFAHSPSTAGYDNKYVNWLKHNHISPISIYVDVSMQVIPSNKTKNYAWLVESKTIQPHMYHWCESNIDFLKQYYIRVFTHDVELAAKSDIFTLTQCSGKSFIQRGLIYPKSKLVSMIASAGVIGVALGLGAQTLVRDILSGIFMLVEDQYGVGDKIDVLDVKGVVETVGLRITTVRDSKGTIWYLRNGEILKVGNQSQPKSKR